MRLPDHLLEILRSPFSVQVPDSSWNNDWIAYGLEEWRQFRPATSRRPNQQLPLLPSGLTGFTIYRRGDGFTRPLIAKSADYDEITLQSQAFHTRMLAFTFQRDLVCVVKRNSL